MAFGKISGPMLQPDLVRQGVDLSVDTNLTYFDVTNRRLGVNTLNPTQSLDVNGNVKLGNISILGNSITSDTSKINLGAPENIVLSGGTQYDVLYTDGTGNLAFANLNIIAGLDAFTGNNITLGANTVGSFDTAVALTTTTIVTDAIALLNLNASDFQTNVAAYETYANANAAILYDSITGANAAIVTANTAVVSYIDTLNTAMTANIVAANAAIVTANTALKSYVDSANTIQQNLITSLQGQVYANANVASYLPIYSGNITASAFIGNVITNYISANTGTVVTITGTGALSVPVGDSSNRPTGKVGDIRFNTELSVNTLEFFDGTQWIPFQNRITDQQLTPDGTSTNYALIQTVTSAESLLVSINGTVQRPGASNAYTVSGGDIIFSEAPLATDIVDIRYIASATSTILTNLSTDISTSGNLTASIFYAGNIVVDTPNISISTTSPTVVDYFSSSIYRSTKYSIQSSVGSMFQADDLWVIQDGTQAYITNTGNITTANLGIYSSVLTGSNVQLYFTPTNANTQLRVYKTQFLI